MIAFGLGAFFVLFSFLFLPPLAFPLSTTFGRQIDISTQFLSVPFGPPTYPRTQKVRYTRAQFIYAYTLYVYGTNKIYVNVGALLSSLLLYIRFEKCSHYVAYVASSRTSPLSYYLRTQGDLHTTNRIREEHNSEHETMTITSTNLPRQAGTIKILINHIHTPPMIYLYQATAFMTSRCSHNQGVCTKLR